MSKQVSDFEQAHAPGYEIACNGMAQIMNAIPGKPCCLRRVGPVIVNATLIERSSERGTEDKSRFLPNVTRLAPVKILSVVMSTERRDSLFR
jgi:hypothetical protein